MAINKPYPKYKNSNIPWLGEIPEHWEIEKVKRQFEVSRGRVIANTDLIDNGNYPVYSSQTKHKGLLGKIDTYDYDGEYISWTTDGVYAGTTFVRKGKFNATNICGLLKPKNNVNIDYFGYLFSHIIPPNKRPDTNGAKIMSNEMKNISFIIPPFEEQTAIARFLDYKLAKINRFIQKKKQLIKLFNEQKAAIINQAVTKGLDPNAKMKDSGIEWLGEIPEHWEVRKLKRVADVTNGSTPKSDNPDYWNGDIIWLTPEDISKNIGKKVLDSNRKITSEGLDSCGTTLVPRESIILTTRAPIGNICKAGVPLCTNQGCKSIVIKDPNYSVDYLMYFLLAKTKNLQSLGRGTTFMEMSTYSLKSFPLVYPNKFGDILKHIEQETTIINTTISKIEKELALVEEYKTALIAEAVTGKIDVRSYEVPEISEEETYEEIEDPDSYRDSMAAEDAEEYQTTEE